MGGNGLLNRLLMKRDEEWEDEGEDVSSYWIILREREDTENWNRMY
jgi:hypothetical protein